MFHQISKFHLFLVKFRVPCSKMYLEQEKQTDQFCESHTIHTYYVSTYIYESCEQQKNRLLKIQIITWNIWF